ncbi:uncharacterized protein LOC128679826 [Plodia interpunctella]|uniref:uncharacterized protein LOC128679826 n=1 Tax=Plodia interpunctella TaxID=58824 RepID=UPI002367D6DD|nr:uncharacterized protein LOC128679826 [Plodia interpunctella]
MMQRVELQTHLFFSLNVQLLIRGGSQFFLSFSSVLVWVMKNFLLHSLISKECEKFYMGINEIQYICATMLRRDGCTGPKRKMCKNIIRFNSCISYKFNLFGFFEIDAKFPLRFVGVLATYAIVSLQFYFNK